MVKKLIRQLKRRLERGKDKELDIFKGLSEDRFDEAIIIDRMQVRLETINDVFKVVSRPRVPETNDCRFKDFQMQRLSDLWFQQQKTATVEQKHKVGLTYISDFLGLGKDKADAFMKGSRRAYYAIGLARLEIQGANPVFFRKTTAKHNPEIFRNNIAAFWQKIKKIFPNTYTDEEMDFLCNASFEVVDHFIMQLEPILAEDAKINRSLRSNEVFFTPKREG